MYSKILRVLVSIWRSERNNILDSIISTSESGILLLGVYESIALTNRLNMTIGLLDCIVFLKTDVRVEAISLKGRPVAV